MTPRPRCGNATGAASATSSPAGSTPCRGRRRSTRSAGATAPTANSKGRPTATSPSSSDCSTRPQTTRAANRSRAAISPPIPARSTRCSPTRPGGSTGSGRYRESKKGRAAARPFVLLDSDSMPLSLAVRAERWPIAGRFAIARGAKTESRVVVAELSDGRVTGRGECVPYARYGETIAGVVAAIAAMRDRLVGLDRRLLQNAMPAGAARNALDCALWDFEAKASGKPAHALAGLSPPRALITAYTISLDAPDAMAAAAGKASSRKLLKVKLGSGDDGARIGAVRAAAPDAELIVDANEGWRADNLAENLAACAAAGVTLIEQPLPAGDDGALAQVARTIPVCADESVHDTASLSALVGKYDAVTIQIH